MTIDFTQIEEDVCRVIRSRFKGCPDIEDVLAIAKEAAFECVKNGEAQMLEDVKRYCLRRARFRVIDYLRRQERADPVRYFRRLIFSRPTRVPMLPMNIRLPISLKAQLLEIAKNRGWTLSKTARTVLEHGLTLMEDGKCSTDCNSPP